ncbi:MAG: ribonuclease E/G [Alphaproteobacteria bacterium]|nr:ribonuclease E/G [Alphaproteobacteria bacterium]
MTKRMLVDATHPEETRVAIVDGNWLSDFDFERASKKQLKGNIYLAKVIRIEPSLQAAFVEYGGNRHGFLPFSEIHPDYFRIPMADRPHEEESAEDEDDGSEEFPETNEAPADASDDEEEHFHEAHHHDMPEAPPEDAMPEPMEAQPEPSGPLAEFGSDHSHDLGLITDFGNAVVNPGFSPAPAPLEIVGGEVAEEEERYRRPPRPRYKIQEVVKRRQVMLIQVVKEERGNKGAALTTYLSLAGRYCVLMPNTETGGGVSRKITSHQDRRRMKEMLDQLEIPEGMAVILRTAGMEQEPAEIQRDLEYLLRMWNSIREETLQSTAPALIYEEANLIKRSMRDLYAHDVDEILVAGTKGYQLAIDFMRAIMPDQLDKVKLYEEPIPLFFRYNVEKQIDQLYNPTVQLRSGGYIVINPTEALVSIDVNSGRATRERHIESTALKTNLEAASEIARQLRLRDLAGLIVIDFIDMEDGRNNAAVERRLKDAMRVDRARLQIGRISPFGLLELSRQRLRASLTEINFEKCPHCAGMGLIRSVDSAAISILRMIEEEGIRQGSSEITLHVPTKVALYLLNQKRPALSDIERRYGLQVLLHSDDALVPPDFKLERRSGGEERGRGPAVNSDQVLAGSEWQEPAVIPPPEVYGDSPSDNSGNDESYSNRPQGQGQGRRRGRYGFGRNNNRRRNNDQQQPYAPRREDSPNEANGNIAPVLAEGDDNIGNTEPGYRAPAGDINADPQQRRGRRRGRRGGRGRGGERGDRGDRPPRQGQDGSFRGGGDRRRERDNYRPRHDQGDNRPMPRNVHELDTTPREQPEIRVDYAPPQRSEQPRSTQSSSPPPYEVIEDGGDKPKGGWWKKLTGQ